MAYGCHEQNQAVANKKEREWAAARLLAVFATVRRERTWWPAEKAGLFGVTFTQMPRPEVRFSLGTSSSFLYAQGPIPGLFPWGHSLLNCSLPLAGMSHQDSDLLLLGQSSLVLMVFSISSPTTFFPSPQAPATLHLSTANTSVNAEFCLRAFVLDTHLAWNALDFVGLPPFRPRAQLSPPQRGLSWPPIWKVDPAELSGTLVLRNDLVCWFAY